MDDNILIFFIVKFTLFYLFRFKYACNLFFLQIYGYYFYVNIFILWLASQTNYLEPLTSRAELAFWLEL